MRYANASRRLISATILASSSLMLAIPAFAGAPTISNPTSGQLEEVVVTAQFRKENLQTTPMAITAFSSRDIAEHGFTNITNINQSTPGVEIHSAGAGWGPAPQVFIRGIGQLDSSFALEPGVGIYVDDVYYGSLYGSILKLLDLSRIEVLRGPQGTLAGMNNIGGAIKLFSKQPTGDGHGYIQAGYGNLNAIQVKAMTDISVIHDKLFLRISAMSSRRNGYVSVYDYGCLHPNSGIPASTLQKNCKIGSEGGQDLEGLRSALRWLPTPSLDIELSQTVSIDDSPINAQKLVRISVHGGQIPAGINQQIFLTGPNQYTNYGTGIVQSYTDPARYAGMPGAGTHPAVAIPLINHSHAYVTALHINWHLPDGLKLTSITAYQNMYGEYGRDLDLTPYSVNTILYTWAHNQLTQETRLNGSLFGQKVEYTVGQFYYTAYGKFGGVQYNSPGTAHENVFVDDDRSPAWNASGFLHAVYHVTKSLDLTGGVRYTNDNKKYTYGNLNPYDTSQPAYTNAGAINGVVGRYSGSHVDYRANISYRWSRDLMTYADVSTGFRGGGVNPRPFAADQVVSFGPETVTAYEAGLKSDLFDRRLRIDGAIYLNKYRSIVFYNTAPTPESPVNATPVNAGDANISGGELEIDARPTDALQLSATASLTDFRFTKITATGASFPGISLHSHAPMVPKWKFSFGGQYNYDMGNFGVITPRLDLSYQSSMYTEVQNYSYGKIGAYALLNGHVTWLASDGRWQASLSVHNITGRFYYESIVDYPIGISVGTPALPRLWMLSVRRNFN